MPLAKMGALYSTLAKYYDLVYRWKNYEKESGRIHELVQKYKKTGGNELLDVACGTGNHIQYLKRHYIVTGIDLSKDMLKVAKRKHPELKLVQANMTSFNLKRKFDAVTCLFSAIGHLKTCDNLRRAIALFAEHVKTGGVVVIEPFLTEETYRTGSLHALYVDEPDVKIARINLSEKRGRIAVLDFHYLIGTKSGVEHIQDREEVALFDVGEILEIMRANGFRAKFLKRGFTRGRGLCIGVKTT